MQGWGLRLSDPYSKIKTIEKGAFQQFLKIILCSYFLQYKVSVSFLFSEKKNLNACWYKACVQSTVLQPYPHSPAAITTQAQHPFSDWGPFSSLVTKLLTCCVCLSWVSERHSGFVSALCLCESLKCLAWHLYNRPHITEYLTIMPDQAEMQAILNHDDKTLSSPVCLIQTSTSALSIFQTLLSLVLFYCIAVISCCIALST